MYIYIYIYKYTHTYPYIYIYIYIYISLALRPPGTAGRAAAGSSLAINIILYHDILFGADKGGPSKGGFLNNQLSSYTDLCLCHEINGMCKYIIYYSVRKIIDCSGNHLY